MRRADRLFRIVQILRRKRRPVTAGEIAEEMETSLRTIYRDIAQLMADRVPIRGEAGIGYILEGGFDMPPLMLTPDEIEAAMLGAQWVMGRADPLLARAAADLVAKIGAVVPEHLRPLLMEPAVSAPKRYPTMPDAIDMARLRAAIRAQGKLALVYRDEKERASERVVWPIAVSYWETVRLIVAWCELRRAFRHFRTDRVLRAEFLEARYATPRATLRHQWRKEIEAHAQAARPQSSMERYVDALIE
ncbi:MAG: YafY family transcriptional regulator [Alphaproteobacteria bacterium]|nr:YafY family transcriptional regulator [Alphaproteobacteria bacterium]MBV9693591.1 YafY family transcriptional regulator [Alphaproteobacteria bacterium]